MHTRDMRQPPALSVSLTAAARSSGLPRWLQAAPHSNPLLAMLKVRLGARRTCQRWPAPSSFGTGANSASKHTDRRHLRPCRDIGTAPPVDASSASAASCAASASPMTAMCTVKVVWAGTQSTKSPRSPRPWLRQEPGQRVQRPFFLGERVDRPASRVSECGPCSRPHPAGGRCASAGEWLLRRCCEPPSEGAMNGGFGQPPVVQPQELDGEPV